MVASECAREDLVVLAHGLASRLASRARIRALIIKGPAADHHDLRAPRISADVDIWVEADGVAAFERALKASGWDERETSTVSKLTTVHSSAYVHESWPCDIDLHRSWPGFLCPPKAAFDSVWSRRQRLLLAGVECSIPDRSTSVLIAALHALRNPEQAPRHHSEFNELVDRVVPHLGREACEDIVALATEVGALDTARPLLMKMDLPLPPLTPFGIDRELDRWRSRVGAGSSPTAVALNALLDMPMPSRAKAFGRIVWPSESQFRLDHPETRTGLLAATHGRLRRLARAARAVPKVVSGRRSARRGDVTSSFTDSEAP